MKRPFRITPPTARDCLWTAFGAILVLASVTTMHIIHNQQVPLSNTATGLTTAWLPSTVTRWKSPILEMAKKYNLDPNLIAIIITLESGGYSKAHSNDNAEGLMQITPPTAKDIAHKFLKTPQITYNLDDPRTNIEFGAAYLAYLRKTFGTVQQGPDWTATVELVAAGYNGGPGAASNLEKGKGLQDTQTVVYSRDAFNMWRERHAATSPTFDRWQERGGSTLIDLAKTEQ